MNQRRQPGASAEQRLAELPPEWQQVIAAIRPLLEAAGATLVDRDGAVLAGSGQLGTREVPLMWEGRLVGVVHLPDIHTALPLLIQEVEEQLGAPLAELSREGKQRAVRMLEERGAFRLRKAVEQIAQALQVSRFTVYNYLNSDAGRPGVSHE